MGQIHEQPSNVPGCNHEKVLVPKKGLEPPHPCGYMDLNHARLPIPPLRRGKRTRVRLNSLRRQSLNCTSGTGSSPSAGVGLAGCRIDFARAAGPLLPVFLQLVMQRLEADAENLCRASLVVVRGLEGFERS